jgi:hypothetical protein
MYSKSSLQRRTQFCWKERSLVLMMCWSWFLDLDFEIPPGDPQKRKVHTCPSSSLNFKFASWSPRGVDKQWLRSFPFAKAFTVRGAAYETVKHLFLIGGSTLNSKILTGKHWLPMTCDAFKIVLEIFNRSTSCQFY